MRRAVPLLAFTLLALGFFDRESSAATAQPVNMVNGIGLIDYARKPDWKVGDWVQYRVTGSSDLGMTDDYRVTVLIAGEERFWGDDCFWVETITEVKGSGPTTIATLMSYSIFQDSMALVRLQMYSRKTVTEVDENGNPIPILVKRSGGLRSREALRRDGLTLKVDTLGTETVTVDKGTFETVRLKLQQGIGQTTENGDSTMRTEVREERVVSMSPKVPITSVVREEMLNSIVRKTWRVGHSEGAASHVMEEGRGTAVLVDFGSGREATMVPKHFRRSIREQLSGGSKPASTGTKKPSSSTRTARKSG